MPEKNSEYLKDESRQQGNAEQIRFVKAISEIEEIWSGTDAVPFLTVQGSRTGIAGAAVPEYGQILNLSRMSGRIGCGEDENGIYMDVFSGTTLEEIQDCAPAGWFFPSEPTEESATIGGMFATNAAGPSAGYYGKTGDHILEVDVYFPDFGLLTVKRGSYVFDRNGELKIGEKRLKIPAESGRKTICQMTPEPGMDLLDLLAGSEGMLGIFCRLRLRLLKRPKERWRFLFFFEEESDALDFAEEIYRNSRWWEGAGLTMADFINKKSIQIFRAYAKNVTAYTTLPDIPVNMCAVMMEISSEDAEKIGQVLEELLVSFELHGGRDEHSWAGDSPDEYVKMQKFRHGIPESINAKLPVSDVPDSKKLSVDVLVDRRDASDYLREIYEITGGTCAVTIHIPRRLYHIDPLFVDGKTYEEALRQRVRLWQSAVDSGGILAAENGIGKGKMPQMGACIPDSQKQIINQVKLFFDKDEKLNPENGIFYKEDMESGKGRGKENRSDV